MRTKFLIFLALFIVFNHALLFPLSFFLIDLFQSATMSLSEYVQYFNTPKPAAAAEAPAPLPPHAEYVPGVYKLLV